MATLLECDLYEPVKAYLTQLGYDVKGEVKACDLAAVKGDELIVVELKKGFTMDLLYQAIDRQRIADGVYVAIPLPKKGYRDPRYRDMLNLCKRLSLGLIFVDFASNGAAQIDVALHPAEAKPQRKSPSRRKAVLTEHAGRTGSVNTGGVTRRKIITVYKEQALWVALLLQKHGPLKAAELRALGGPEKTSIILQRNFYKWYQKETDCGNRNNTYAITSAGTAALLEYADLLPEGAFAKSHQPAP